MGTVFNYRDYSPVGDVITIVTCIIYMFLMKSTYTVRKKNINLFRMANGLCVIAAVSSIFSHLYSQYEFTGKQVVLYLLGGGMFISLITLFVIFISYLSNLIRLSESEARSMRVVMVGALCFYAFIIAVFPFIRMQIYKTRFWHDQSFYYKIFVMAFLFYAFISIYIIIIYKKRFIKKVRICLQNVMIIAFSCMLIQLIFKQTAFTCVIFTFPILASMFLFHYNAYDAVTGTLDDKSFASYVEGMITDSFTIVSVKYKDVTDKEKEKITEFFSKHIEDFSINAGSFRMKDDRLVTVYTTSRKKDEINGQFKQLMKEIYSTFAVDYKLVFLDSQADITKSNDYIDLCEMVERSMPWNTTHDVIYNDVKKFLHNKVVESALKDIHDKMDLNDDRVQVYCQPVLNTKIGRFTTAEALMRIILPDYGFIYPDDFIPIAEKKGYIHSLSKIILHKTCKSIIKLEEKGYEIERVSVNFSILELREADFCDDVTTIINNTGLEPDKIAIEVTESRNEQDFERVRKVMDTLQHIGIKFYLDDFGTGYSNFARIIGLPIDIIKFDRSLTIMSGKDEDSKYMVGSFSDIFENSEYQVLFEGVEDEVDEQRCIDMNAQYLQGYKYSKPIPIRQLGSFLQKTV